MRLHFLVRALLTSGTDTIHSVYDLADDLVPFHMHMAGVKYCVVSVFVGVSRGYPHIQRMQEDSRGNGRAICIQECWQEIHRVHTRIHRGDFHIIQ